MIAYFQVKTATFKKKVELKCFTFLS